jgi:2-polyprenyl-3-methyl-5-hydroxy-6-metoxy-1,4-benzoquinol methylase
MISSRFQNDSKPHLKLNSLQLSMKKDVDAKVNSNEYQFESISCPICSNTDFETFSEKDRYGLKMSVVGCKTCGMVQTNPRMNQEAYNQFYNVEYRKLYVGIDVATKDFYYTQTKKGESLIQYLKTHNLTPKDWSNFFVLEIGCGAGGILEPFKKLGAKIKGIDLGDEYIQFGIKNHGLDLETGTLKDLKLDQKPDLIIYSHVMEHILDLDDEFKSIQEHSNNDTLLYVEIPGIKNIHSAYRNDFLRYLQNAHTFHYSLGSFSNLLNKHGFELIQGDEYVRSISKKGNASTAFNNCFTDTHEYLKSTEDNYSSFSNKVKSFAGDVKMKFVSVVKKFK